MLALRTDQLGDLAFAIANPKSLNLSDPGTGKTPPVCVNQYRRVMEGIGRTAWVMPKALMAKNAVEITRFTPFNDNDVGIIDGTAAQIDKVMSRSPKILLMGPDRFKAIHHQLPDDVNCLDVDELHMCFGGAGTGFNGFSSTPSARTQAFYDFQPRVIEEILMTGTLVNGRLDTAYPAIHAIEPGYYPFGYDQFMGHHAYCDERGKPLAWLNHERLGTIFGRHGIRRTFESVFGKQAIVHETQWVEMDPRQRAIYDLFEEQAYLELEEFMISGAEPGVATIRARQIMEHPNHFRDLRDPYNLPHVDIMPGAAPAKLEALAIHLEDHNRRGTPLIIFAALVPQQEQILALCKRMGRRVGLLNGETKTRDRNAVDVGFQEGSLNTIIASQPVATVGYNWQFCGEHEVDHIVNVSLTYKDTDYSQGFKRAVRGKRNKPLRVTTLAYLRSVDLKVMNINERKSLDAHKVDPTQEVIRFSSHEEIAA